MEVPRPRWDLNAEAPPPTNALTVGGGALALEDTKPDGSIPKSAPMAPPAPVAPPDLSMAIVPAGSVPKAPPVVPVMSSRTIGGADGADVPGMGYAFIEFATIEGASK